MFENDIFVKLNRVFHRTVIKYSQNPRPASPPYVTGDGFRHIAKHIFEDKNVKFPASRVKEKDIVFVQTNLIKDFFERYHSNINAPYILVTHNGDESVSEADLGFIDYKIIHWFGLNADVVHVKLTPIPFGLENKWYYLYGIPKLFKSFGFNQQKKTNRILYGFNVATNFVERKPALDLLSRLSIADKIAGWPNPVKYMKLLSSYSFVASPPGNGIDCRRTWEAMCLGVVPIVKRSILTEYFFGLGLPLWIVDDWNELSRLTEKELEKKYKEFESRFKCEALFYDYWADKILKF